MDRPCRSCDAAIIRLDILCVPKVVKVEVHFPIFLNFNEEILRFQVPVIDITWVEVVNYHDNICQVAENILLLKVLFLPLIKKLAEVTLVVKFLNHAEMAWIVKKIIDNIDDEWVRVLFHEPDFLVDWELIFLL